MEWADVEESYRRFSEDGGRSTVAILGIIRHLSRQPRMSEVYPSLSHERVKVSSAAPDKWCVLPHVAFTPSGDSHIAFELWADHHNKVAEETLSADAALDTIAKGVGDVIAIDRAGPNRGFFLLCDIEAIFVERRFGVEQESFVFLERGGCVSVFGLAESGAFANDTIVFQAGTDLFDDARANIRSEWLGKKKVMRKGGSGFEVTLGFRLRGGIESSLTFISSNKSNDLPQTVENVLEDIHQSLRPHLADEVSRLKNRL